VEYESEMEKSRESALLWELLPLFCGYSLSETAHPLLPFFEWKIKQLQLNKAELIKGAHQCHRCCCET